MSRPSMKGGTSPLFCLIVAVYSYGIAAQQTVCENATMGDIVFLVDGSSSIGDANFQEVRSFLRSAIKALDIGPNKVRIGLVQYSDETYQEFLLSDHMDRKSLLGAVERIPYRQGGTETGKAIKFLLAQNFTKDVGSRASQRVPQIVVVITDGDSADDVKGPARLLKQQGVIVFAIGVGQINKEQLKDIANQPSQHFLFTIDSYQALQRLSERLLQTVCISMEDQRLALEERFSDIFILVDNGIAQVQFSIFRSELLKLINQLDVGASTHRVSLAQYGADIKVEFLLNAFQTKQETLAAVRRFRLRPQLNRPRNLGAALEYANTHFFSSDAGGRAHQGSKQFLVIVSGKDSDDRVSRPARKIKSAGIKIVGMSAGATMNFIDLLASKTFAFDSPRLTLLKEYFVTEKPEPITEDCKGANVADIVFIVDESGSIGTNNFQLVRTFLHSIVSGLDVSQTRVRVGIVTYNERPTAHAYLNAFNSRTDIQQFMKILPYRGGGTYTGAALNFAREEVFIGSRGRRRSVQQVAVVITDGESQDNVSDAAAALRRAGVTIYAVGIENANEAELKEMVSYPSSTHVFSVDSFTKLKPMTEAVLKTLCSNIINRPITDRTSKEDPKEACLQKDEADFFFLIDDSGSIQNQDFYDMKKFIIEFLHTFIIGPQHVRMGLVKYADLPSLQFDLTKHSNVNELEKAVESITHDGGGTNTGGALSSMKEHFEKAEVSRGHKVPEYLVVITDGKSQDQVSDPAKDLRAQGIIIYAIGVKEANMAELQDIAGDSRRTFFVDNFDSLRSIKVKITEDICIPDVCKSKEADIIFLADSSGSIDEESYQKMKNFMKSVISKFAIGQNEVHIGVMQFSSDYKREFPLNQYYNKEEMSRAIDAMQQMNQGTNTGDAITKVSRYFDKTGGGRPDLSQRLIVITDGKSQDEVSGPAAALRDKGVLIYAIGVEQASTDQLVKMTGSMDRVFNERSFDALQDLENSLALRICESTKDCKQIQRADIIFLVDGSGSIKLPHFRSMQKFMESVANQTTVGTNLTRFGIILYSDEPESVLTLKDCRSKRDFIKAITGLKSLEANTYTSKALKFSLQYFLVHHGGRKEQKVPQILMVITDGIATDPEDLQQSSDALRDIGVTVFSIGVKEAKRTELVTMAGGDESKVFEVDDFKALETLYTKMSSVLCSSAQPVCRKEKIDLVFLLDQSSSINAENVYNYQTMINFTAELVNSFEVNETAVHIGLAKFSTDPNDEFDLNTYSKREDMIEHIHKMKYSGGTSTNIGRALAHIKDYFTKSRGSRGRVPKTLVLITDGGSHDDVEDPADELRKLHIDVLAVGVGDTHDLELLQITGTPERLFNVRKYEDLKKIKTKLLGTICCHPADISNDCNIDIAVGFDISRRPRAPGEVLISGHTKLKSLLQEIISSVSSVQGVCCSRPVGVNIAFQLVDGKGNPLYDTNFEGYSKDVVEKVMNFPMSEPTYFNTKLLASFTNMFKAKSRADVKVLVIFSDGLDEDVRKLENKTELLRQSGVSALLTVALEGVHDPAQLQMVEFGRGFGYQLPLRIGMQNVGYTILTQIDTVLLRECCNVTCKCSGSPGMPGSPGSPGPKGSPGQKGQPGFPGEEGAAGDRGPPGPAGPHGFQGCPGVRGQKGHRGITGDRGDLGEDGLPGVDGEQGLTGPNGTRGERGHPGEPGIPGISGEPGQKGERGLRGDPGEPGVDNTIRGRKGDPGNQGFPGKPGPDGRPGGNGVSGNLGQDGRRGPPGEKGAPGGAGAQGLPGSPGNPGPQGRRGGDGERGPDGNPGFPGPQGESGLAGGQGLPGRRGPNGQKGQPGDPGVKGAPGSQGPRGVPGQDGRDGYGPTGPKGVKGDPGFPGFPGLPGQVGSKGGKGDPGIKGYQGREGNSGKPGDPGPPGDPGHVGHRGPRGPPGKGLSECQLIGYLRDNCQRCPAYPTELVFGLDISEDVTETAFERQRAALLNLLKDIAIAETDCPVGARVAVVAYSNETKYLIRFQDYRHKTPLNESVKNITVERSSTRRELGGAMRFVGHNVFKRVRGGLMTRKVAVFFSNGVSPDISDIVTAMMEYRALNIVPAVISLRNAPAVSRALEVDDTRRAIFTVLGRDLTGDLRKVKQCAICYDPCNPAEECSFIQDVPKPQEVDVDLAMVVDSSREMQADEYSGAQQLLGSVVEQLAVSSQPRRAGSQARVAIVQQSGAQDTKAEFDLQTYQNHDLMRTHLIQTMKQQGGSSALGQTLEFTLKALLKASQPRRRRMLLTVVGTQTAYRDRDKLRYISQKAKCEGVALFVVTVGERYNRTQVEELASLPVQQHLIHVGRLKADEQGYAQRFIRVFLSALNRGINTYPPPSIKQICSQLTEQDDGQGSADLDYFAAEPMEMEEPVKPMEPVEPVKLVEMVELVEPVETVETFVEETGGKSETSQLHDSDPLTTGDDQSSISAAKLYDPCFLSLDVGECQNYTIMWYFDSYRRMCTPFWYGGCSGNKNRFETEQDCEALCLGKSQ